MDQPSQQHAHIRHTFNGDIECGTCGKVLVTATDAQEHTDDDGGDVNELAQHRLTQHQYLINVEALPKPSDTDPSHDLLAITESFASITAAIAGYRAQLINHGFPEDAATEMAVSYHDNFINHIFAGMNHTTAQARKDH
jgi:hypothetical protein